MKVKPGDRVLVPWGLDDVLGTVVDVFGPPGDPFVRVQVRLPDMDEDDDPVEVPVKMNAVRPVPSEGPTGSGTIETTGVGIRGNRLVAVVAVRGAGLDRDIEVWASRDDTRRLETHLGHDGAQDALARFAAHVVAHQLEEGGELMNYLLSEADVASLLRVASARPT